MIVRPNGDPLYTLTNPVDDAMMRIVVLRRRPAELHRARLCCTVTSLLGIAKEVPLFGHRRTSRAKARRSCRSGSESNLFLHRENGFIPEGRSTTSPCSAGRIAPDRDALRWTMIEKFDEETSRTPPTST